MTSIDAVVQLVLDFCGVTCVGVMTSVRSNIHATLQLMRECERSIWSVSKFKVQTQYTLQYMFSEEWRGARVFNRSVSQVAHDDSRQLRTHPVVRLRVYVYCVKCVKPFEPHNTSAVKRPRWPTVIGKSFSGDGCSILGVVHSRATRGR